MDAFWLQLFYAGAGSALATVAVALALVISQSAKYVPSAPGEGLRFDTLAQFPDDLPALGRRGVAGDSPIAFRRYPARSPARPLVILVHGSGWHSMQFHRLASALAAQDVAEVITPDMRGHGPSPERRGDVDHIGQMESDIAALIDVAGQGREVILGGHSSGGGFVIRFAGGKFGHKADGFVLLAPYVHHRAPTTRPKSGGWARPAIRRLVGLSILNAFGITALNGLPVISFAMPRSVLDGPLGDTATLTYSYRLNAGFAPRARYRSDLARLTRPFVLLAGESDEAFVAPAYESLFRAHTGSGGYRLVPGAGHLGIVDSPATLALLAHWLRTRRLPPDG